MGHEGEPIEGQVLNLKIKHKPPLTSKWIIFYFNEKGDTNYELIKRTKIRSKSGRIWVKLFKNTQTSSYDTPYYMLHIIHFPEDFFCAKFWKRERMEL